MASVLVLLAMATALVLRFTGAGFMLPHRLEGDERVYAAHIAMMRGDVADPEHDARYGYYPHLVQRIALQLAPTSPPKAAALPLEDHLARASADLLLMRRIQACLSILGVFATYRLTRLFAGRAASLFAAALVATSLITQWYAPQARPHGAAVGFLPLAVLACVQVRRHPRPVAYAAAGVCIGLAVGVLQSAFLLLATLGVAHLLRDRVRELRPHVSLLAALVVVGACVRLFYPFVFVSEALPGHHVFGQASLGAGFFDGSGFRMLIETLWDRDPLIFVLAAGACAAWLGLRLRRRADERTARAPLAVSWLPWLRTHGDLVVVLAFALPYALAFGFYRLTFPRYLLPLVPFLACFAAVGFERLAAVLVSRGVKPLAVRAVAVAVLALQGAAAIQLTLVRVRPDTLTETARWLQAHTDRSRERTLLLAPLDVPLLRDARAMPPYATEDYAYPWRRYQALLPDSARDEGFGLDTLTLSHVQAANWNGEALLKSFDVERLVVNALETSRRRRFGQLVREISREREVRISPMATDEGDDRPFLFRDQNDEYPDGGNWAWRLMCARCLGPVIEIHRLR